MMPSVIDTNALLSACDAARAGEAAEGVRILAMREAADASARGHGFSDYQDACGIDSDAEMASECAG